MTHPHCAGTPSPATSPAAGRGEAGAPPEPHVYAGMTLYQRGCVIAAMPVIDVQRYANRYAHWLESCGIPSDVDSIVSQMFVAALAWRDRTSRALPRQEPMS